MRIEQPPGKRGSLKWIQRAVAERWPELEAPVMAWTAADSIEWVSPLAADSYAEYRDASFLDVLGLGQLVPALGEFWPQRGPQWDALARLGTDGVLLVEAKAHIREFLSPGTSAGEKSRSTIERRLEECALFLGASRKAAWAETFYQYTNRLAHLWFLRQHGVNAYLALVGFVGDGDMAGPASGETWDAAYLVASYALGLPERHALSKFIIKVHPQVPHE